MRSSQLISRRFVVCAVVFGLVGAGPSWGLVMNGSDPSLPRFQPVIEDHGDAPSSISIPLYSTGPGDTGAASNGPMLPEPSSVLLAGFGATAFAFRRRSRS